MKPQRMLVPSSLALLACALAAACHGAQTAPDKEVGASPAPPATGAAPASSLAPAAPAAPVSAWDGMNHEQREQYMKHTVLPAMREAFAKFDPKEFGEIKCATCHGEGAKKRGFKMPNADLPKLPTDPDGWKKLEAEDGETVKFMKETVVPKMAAFVGEAPYDPATQKGFGCFECHTPKK